MPLVFRLEEDSVIKKIEMNKEYIAVLLIEILFEKGFVNKETYMNICKHSNLYISQVV